MKQQLSPGEVRQLLIHDLDEEQYNRLSLNLEAGSSVVAPGGDISHCIGCFGCWTKTPGKCVIKDDYAALGKQFCDCTDIIIISRMVYGGFSPFVKNVLDRSIGCLLPFFTQGSDKRLHHKTRSGDKRKFSVHFYSDDYTPDERRLAKELIPANAENYRALEHDVHFYTSPDALKGVRL